MLRLCVMVSQCMHLLYNRASPHITLQIAAEYIKGGGTCPVTQKILVHNCKFMNILDNFSDFKIFFTRNVNRKNTFLFRCGFSLLNSLIFFLYGCGHV